jgi:hypothetical protein
MQGPSSLLVQDSFRILKRGIFVFISLRFAARQVAQFSIRLGLGAQH